MLCFPEQIEGGQRAKKPCQWYSNLMVLKGNYMASSGRRWTVQDREGNPIYLTAERWQHIIEGNNHPGNGRL
jgi:hypothetical protein